MSGRGLLALLCAAGLAVACAGTLAQAVRGPSQLGVVEAFDCAYEELRALGYKATAFDRDAGSLSAQKGDPTARRPLALFRRVWDRVRVSVGKASSGSQLEVRAQTFVEFESSRGPTEEEESASATARVDSKTVLDRCSTPRS